MAFNLTAGNKSHYRQWLAGWGFLLPNLCGVLLFVLTPLVVSFCLAFTNWDMSRHNLFKTEPLEFLGLRNFIELFQEPQFIRYLGNTLFLMMGIPVATAGSLGAALLLHREPKSQGVKFRCGALIPVLVFVLALGVLLLLGFDGGSLLVILCVLGILVMSMGAMGGATVYRTLFYTPHFTAGVATFILWKKIYNPENGPLNVVLKPVLAQIEVWVKATPPILFTGLAILLFISLLIWVGRCADRLGKAYREEEYGIASVLIALFLMILPFWSMKQFVADRVFDIAFIVSALLLPVVLVACMQRHDKVEATTGGRKGGEAFFLGFGMMLVGFLMLGLLVIALNIHHWAAAGLRPPGWLYDYHWAKPSLMIMALWAAIGSNNMILYLAGLSNIPEELYEAASIDGATGIQKFIHVTWPQLMPITFFILIMSIIGGLQGGFEMARTMTQGGPAGATTTLSYAIYIEGFETGRLGYASGLAWAMFFLIFAVTVINFKFGNRYVND